MTTISSDILEADLPPLPVPAAGPARRALRPMRYVPALDGVRGLAVLAVVAYHLPVSWLPGGFLGVDVFFVLSGFLITSLLLRERVAEGRTGLRQFWLRRARRLLPAAVAVVVGTTVLASVVAPDAMGRLRGDVPASLAYVINWRLIFRHDTYAQAFGRPPLLQHLWSLGIEEQFYLVWPLAFVALAWSVRRRGRGSLERRVAMVAFGGAVLSGLLMAVLVHSGQDPSAVYFDPGTHATGLLLGAAMAATFPLWRRSGSIATLARHLLEGAALAAAVVLAVLLATLHQSDAASYRGGLQLAALCAAVIVVVAGHPGTRLGRLFGSRPLVWLGQRSYSIYLWHWPIFEVTRPGIDIHLAGPLDTILRLALTVAAADFSYRYVEQPWRTGVAARALRRWWHDGGRPLVASLSGIAVVVTVAMVGLLVDAPGSGGSGAVSTPASRAELPVASAPLAVPHGVGTAPASVLSRIEGLLRPPPAEAAPGRPAPTVATPAPAGAAAVIRPVVPVLAGPVLAIGDSVLLGAANDLTTTLGARTVVDAVVGRQVAQGLDRLAGYKAAGRLTGLGGLVVALGTNGPMTVDQCQQFIALAAGVPKVVFVTVRVPRPWQDTTNASIARCTTGVAHVTAADWYAASGGPDVLGPDQVHESVAGRELYVSVVTAALAR